MAKNKDEIVPLHEDQFNLLDTDAPVLDANLILANAGLTAPRVAADDLRNRQFVIRYYKQFETAKNKRGYAYFCVVMLEDTGEIYTTVLGGDNVVDFLDTAKAVAPKRPIRMLIDKQKSEAGFEFWVIK
jgi:hypothetical protein